MEELWYHGGGCRAWLKVERNTLTHEIRCGRAGSRRGCGEGGARDGDFHADPHRLDNGGLIDRSQPLNFTFDGKAFQRLCRAIRWPRR